jgi:UDP-glucose:(glucosyl)LPS alpha-1,2-glucosyltransferase
MSVVYKGEVQNTDLTKNAKGGTEQMRGRLVRCVDSTLLEQVAIHFSRPDKIYEDVPNILYCHDLPEDPSVQSVRQEMHKYEKFVFVSYWQRDQFINKFNIPYSKCAVIQNAVERLPGRCSKPSDQINLIYHTTPHRGLELVLPIFDKLCEMHDNIHMDVYSSFGVYGWEQRDVPYQPVFDRIKDHPHMTYHGAVSNDVVMKALEKAHIFLYPSIWQETSCIALIEAMTSGVFSIYPSYGALPETGSFASNIGMYEFSEDMNANASSALNFAHQIITKQKKNPLIIENVMASAVSKNNMHSIDKYTQDWNSLLKTVTERWV